MGPASPMAHGQAITTTETNTSTGMNEDSEFPEIELSKLRVKLALGWSLSIPVLLIAYFTGYFAIKDYMLLALATLSPTFFSTGICSPVIMESSTSLFP